MQLQFYIGITIILFFVMLMIFETYYEQALIGFESLKQQKVYNTIAIIAIIAFIISLLKLLSKL